MALKKIKITATRVYTKTAEIDVYVDSNLVGEALVKHLRESKKIDTEIEDGIAATSLSLESSDYEYFDKKQNEVGQF